MRSLLPGLVIAALAATPIAAQAGGYGPRVLPPQAVGQIDPLSGRAPWNAAWEYDSGGDNDRRPELPYYQQGRGQQTGGPARNLLPDVGLHLFPR